MNASELLMRRRND